MDTSLLPAASHRRQRAAQRCSRCLRSGRAMHAGAQLTERLAQLLHRRGARRAAHDGTRQRRAAAGDQGHRAGDASRGTGVDRRPATSIAPKRAMRRCSRGARCCPRRLSGHVVGLPAAAITRVALMGELSAQTLQARGVLGYVVDGGSRDTDRARAGVSGVLLVPDAGGHRRALDSRPPSASRSPSAPSPSRRGDYLLGDRDGVVVDPAGDRGGSRHDAPKRSSPPKATCDGR